MRLGKIFGIDVSLNWTTLIIAILIASGASDFMFTTVPTAGAVSVGLAAICVAVGFLASILAHEYGHALTARRYGVGCHSIILHLLGGIASLTGSPPTAKSEFWIAIAGPAVSWALAIVGAILSVLTVILAGGENVVSSSFFMLSFVNGILGTFNLIPAFPMDGGRVFRAIVWHKTKNFLKSTKIAVAVGKGFGGVAIGAALLMCFGVYIPFFGTGIFNGIWLGFLAALIMWMGEQELKHARMKRV